MTDSDPALIFPQETASSGRAPESEPSNSWPVFCAAGWLRERERETARRRTYYVDSVICAVALISAKGMSERSHTSV